MHYAKYLSAVINLIIVNNVICDSYLPYNGPCRRSNPNLEKCLISAFEGAKTEFAFGNWTHGIQSRTMDPFILYNHVFGTGKIFQLYTHKMTVLGLSNFKVERYKINPNTLTVDITMLFPKISDTGDYSGTINILGLKFKGSFKSRYRNTRAFIHFEMHKYWKDGREFVEILDVNLSSDKKFIALQSTHKIHDIAIPILYPYLERSYGLIIKDELNKLLRRIPFDRLLPK